MEYAIREVNYLPENGRKVKCKLCKMVMHHTWQGPSDDIVKLLELEYTFDEKTNTMNIVCDWCWEAMRWAFAGNHGNHDTGRITFFGESSEELEDTWNQLKKYKNHITKRKLRRGDEVDA